MRRPRGRIFGFALAAAVAGAIAAQATLIARVGQGAVLAAAPVVGPAAGDVSFGRADAPHVVVALVSLACSHCARWERDEMPKLLDGPVAAGRIRLVIRQFPLDMPSLSGAAALACLPPELRPAAFSALARGPRSWIGGKAAAAAALAAPGNAAVAACATGDAARRAILESERNAHDAWGVGGTPTFVAGRRVLVGETDAATLDAAAAH